MKKGSQMNERRVFLYEREKNVGKRECEWWQLSELKEGRKGCCQTYGIIR